MEKPSPGAEVSTVKSGADTTADISKDFRDATIELAEDTKDTASNTSRDLKDSSTMADNLRWEWH